MKNTSETGLSAVIKKRLTHFDLDVSLECPAGKILAVVGPSGAGKSTLLRCISGLEKPDQGEIRCNDILWSKDDRSLQTPQKRRIGLLFQDALLFPHMSLLENILFVCKQHDKALELLESMGISHLKDRKPHQISGGERQRGALCQVLARKPRLLLLDEPFSALDVENRLALRERLINIPVEWNIPTLLVTHDLVDAMTMAGRIISLINGREDPHWLERQNDLLAKDLETISSTVNKHKSTQKCVGEAA